jgi:hypothetical protein
LLWPATLYIWDISIWPTLWSHMHPWNMVRIYEYQIANLEHFFETQFLISPSSRPMRKLERNVKELLLTLTLSKDNTSCSVLHGFSGRVLNF